MSRIATVSLRWELRRPWGTQCTNHLSGAVISDKATGGKRRAETPKRRRRSESSPPPKAGRRADRPDNHTGLTPEFLQQMRDIDIDDTWAPQTQASVGRRVAPQVQEARAKGLFASIDADLSQDTVYQHALWVLSAR